MERACLAGNQGIFLSVGFAFIGLGAGGQPTFLWLGLGCLGVFAASALQRGSRR